jgi:hypothetical protein
MARGLTPPDVAVHRGQTRKRRVKRLESDVAWVQVEAGLDNQCKASRDLLAVSVT